MSPRSLMWPTAMLLLACVAGVVLASIATPASADESARGARIWIEAGPSFDNSQSPTLLPMGYAIGSGVEFGRTFGVTMSVGFEHYPGTAASYTQAGFVAPSGGIRYQGGGNRQMLTAAVGARVGMPTRYVEPFVEFGFGLVSVTGQGMEAVDVATGALIYPGYRYGNNEALGEIGMGVRLPQRSGYAWQLGVRFRGYSELFEGSDGGSIQARLGLVTP